MIVLKKSIYTGSTSDADMRKALFVIKCKGSTLSLEVKKIINKNVQIYNNNKDYYEKLERESE